MSDTTARRGVGRTAAAFMATMALVAAMLAASSSLRTASAADPVATTTTLTVNPDGTGTILVTAEGATPTTNYVDMWVDSTWQRAYALTAGSATFALGTQSLGDHRITARYRADATTQASQASILWTAPGTIAYPTTTKLTLNPDGTGNILVTAEGGATPTNLVDLWVDSTWQ
ncbi:MAG: hypothetical protein ABIR57_11115, partial [Aeromicrobium sp.]